MLPQIRSHRGTKFAACDLYIGLPSLREELGPGGAPDGIVETWIHESVHGRRYPWGPVRAAERRYRGFEEGLAEGITRLVSRWADFVPGLPAYGRYVQTYEALADVVGVSPEAIYRRLYALSYGSVMDGFVEEVDALRGETGAVPLTDEQRGRLEDTARDLFSRVYVSEPASARLRSSIRQAWRGAFR